MSGQSNRGTGFEERLLAKLKAVVAERGAAVGDVREAPAVASPGPRGRRTLRLALAGVAVIAVAALVLVLGSGGGSTSRAYAVEPLAGGGVAIKIYSLEDSSGLEEALRRAGIPAQVDWLSAQTTCRERNLKPASVRTSMGGRTGGFEISGPAPALTIGVMSADQYRRASREFRRKIRSGHERPGEEPDLPNVSFEPRSFTGGQTLVVVGSPEPYGGDPEGGYRASVQVVEGPVGPCEPVAEAAGSIGAIQLPGGSAGSGAAAASAAVPAAGQFLFRKTMVVQAETWEPGGRGTGPRDHPRHFTSRAPGPNGHAALVPTTKEVWTAPDGKTHVRETLGRIEFVSPADQRLWEEAGSPPPFEFDPAEHHVGEDAAGDPTKEYESLDYRGRHAFAIVPKLFGLPTEAAALRAAIEGASPGSPPSSVESDNGRTTTERLLEILAEPESTATLAAAAFEALGEMPGVRHEGQVVDAAGRSGEALGIEDETGFGRRVIFDPATSRVLAEAEVVFAPPSTATYRLPAGTPYRETAYLGSAIVDSAGETGG